MMKKQFRENITKWCVNLYDFSMVELIFLKSIDKILI